MIEDLIENLAPLIYDSWSFDAEYVPWIDGGNSDRQNEARAVARSVIHLIDISGLIVRPREPTDAMAEAGWRAANDIGPNRLGVITDSAVCQIYRAMTGDVP